MAVKLYSALEKHGKFGFVNMQSTGRLIIKAAFLADDTLADKSRGDSDIKEFLATGFLRNRVPFLEVIDHLKKL